MDTIGILIVVVGAVAIVVVVAFAQFRVKLAELEHEREASSRQETMRSERAEAQASIDASRAAALGLGPPEGTTVGVHIGAHLIQGRRVLRGSPEAEGWIVVDDAELLEGNRKTPMGGRQWLPAVGSWMQEL